jgi:hypothetical protein
MDTGIGRIRKRLKRLEGTSQIAEELSRFNGNIIHSEKGPILRTKYSYIFLWTDCSISKESVREVKKHLYEMPARFTVRSLHKNTPLSRITVTRALWVLEALEQVERIDKYTYKSIAPSIVWFKGPKSKRIPIEGGLVECPWKRYKMEVKYDCGLCPYFNGTSDGEIICTYHRSETPFSKEGRRA